MRRLASRLVAAAICSALLGVLVAATGPAAGAATRCADRDGCVLVLRVSGLIDPVVSGGTLSFSTTSGGWFEPIRTMGSISHGRDSDQFPINAATNTRLSIRMFSGAASAQSGGITWFTCWGEVPSCASARSFVVQPGWNTYDLDMTQAPDLMNNTNGWSGAITGVRITPTGSTPTTCPTTIGDRWSSSACRRHATRRRMQCGTPPSASWPASISPKPRRCWRTARCPT